MRCAVIDISTYIVINMIVANADTDVPPVGTMLFNVDADTSCDIGWVFDPVTKTFSDPTIGA